MVWAARRHAAFALPAGAHACLYRCLTCAQAIECSFQVYVLDSDLSGWGRPVATWPSCWGVPESCSPSDCGFQMHFAYLVVERTPVPRPVPLSHCCSTTTGVGCPRQPRRTSVHSRTILLPVALEPAFLSEASVLGFVAALSDVCARPAAAPTRPERPSDSGHAHAGEFYMSWILVAQCCSDEQQRPLTSGTASCAQSTDVQHAAVQPEARKSADRAHG